MQSLRRDCKREFDSEFGNGRPRYCPQCGLHVNVNLSRHIMDFHLVIGQLWPYPVSWCSVWKGTAQDCIDHLRHHAVFSVELGTLGKYFPPWKVTCATWIVVLRPGVSCIAMDVMLFHQHGARLVHRYRVYADPLPHESLRGSFMLRLTRFTIQASAAARSVTTRDRDSRSESFSTLVPLDYHTPDSVPQARRSMRTAATVTFTADSSPDVSAPARAFSAAASICHVGCLNLSWSGPGSGRAASLCPITA